MTEREKIAAKIRALRAKTVENGCTEAEALAAAGLEFQPTTLRNGQRGGEEYARGRAAAEGVALNPGLAAQAGAARIGGRA
ncbi:hypothetical protein [Phenylobacterium sp.]|uniref:hypothetical protein n=1 Tax=Phenylobacterium sp. TaxID=1871053 RepID=UPI00395A283D